MEFSIPDGEIVDNDASFSLMQGAVDYIDKLWALHALGEAHRVLSRDMDDVDDSEPPNLVLYDGGISEYHCVLDQICVPFSTFVLTSYGAPAGKFEYLLLRQRGNYWYVSSKKLLQPSTPPWYHLSDDQIHEQRWARVLAFAAQANANGWYQENPLY